MAFRTIAVFVDPAPACADPILYAVGLARQHEAHIIAICVVPTTWETKPSSMYARGDDAIHDVITVDTVGQLDAIEAARQAFSRNMGERGSQEFRVVREFEAARHIQLNLLHVDIVVTGPLYHERQTAIWPETELFAAGVPFVVVPDEWFETHGDGPPERVLVGWNASGEARRAITASLPLLKQVDEVWILVVDGPDNARRGEEPGADIALYLSRHGVKVTVMQCESAAVPVHSVILDTATAVAADLIVLGAYSHSRMVERIFGGVTHDLFKSAPFPLLVAR
ncbi:universal stress protein UspA [Acuticoccus sediminis]|uniref:Universal stress protein UspA n=1 Tax=Acuticoccus sediminis TaxID=2184697 RepID=A0A8B2NQR5_9HYPH|nr:universal stress protein [Acuticoccus sediminis]RAH99552.1 universal stress protein UspA [Acuticoccus sediminis]